MNYLPNPICKLCSKKITYDIVSDRYTCGCTTFRSPMDMYERKDLIEKAKEQAKEDAAIPPSSDQVSLADQFENELQAVLDRYCSQGMTIGAALGAMQNRMFHLMLNIHLPNIVEVVKRNIK